MGRRGCCDLDLENFSSVQFRVPGISHLPNHANGILLMNVNLGDKLKQHSEFQRPVAAVSSILW